MIKKGSWVVVQATPVGSRRSYPAANWIHENDGAISIAKLMEDAPFQSTLDVVDIEDVSGAQDTIYDFNIIGMMTRFRR